MAEINPSLVSELPGTILGEILSVTDEQIAQFLESIEYPQEEGEVPLGNMPRLAAACFVVKDKLIDAIKAEIEVEFKSFEELPVKEHSQKVAMFIQKNEAAKNQIEMINSLGWNIADGAFKGNEFPILSCRKGGIIVGITKKETEHPFEEFLKSMDGVIVVKTVTVAKEKAKAEA